MGGGGRQIQQNINHGRIDMGVYECSLYNSFNFSICCCFFSPYEVTGRTEKIVWKIVSTPKYRAWGV